MAIYSIKMLKDEQNQPFVPLVSTNCVRDENNQTLQQILDKKLGPDNLLAGDNISITTQGNNCYIAVDLPAGLNVINNLTTTQSGQGSLDAYQGKVLKDSIPVVVNDLSSTDTNKALSAYQGYLLNHKVVPTGGTTGQVLKKSSNDDHALEWGDVVTPDVTQALLNRIEALESQVAAMNTIVTKLNTNLGDLSIEVVDTW